MWCDYCDPFLVTNSPCHLKTDVVNSEAQAHERTPVQPYQSNAPREPTTRPLYTGARTSSVVPTPGGTLVSPAVRLSLIGGHIA
ncbi:hypothetical protein J6590_084407 [Homalodisca vitripennis]|nr:hypothetical protein J6590_084407 [Homalodisca vitripennis]